MVEMSQPAAERTSSAAAEERSDEGTNKRSLLAVGCSAW
jgi:hypothetical protein